MRLWGTNSDRVGRNGAPMFTSSAGKLPSSVETNHTAVIPVSKPTKAGGFDGIHFRLCLFTSSFGRLYSRAGRIGIEHKNERRIL